MTSRPQLKLGSHLLPGLVAVLLFGVLAIVFLSASFGAPKGFPAGATVTDSIGYALFNLSGGAIASEGFLIAFEIIDVVLIAALVAGVMLARREVNGQVVDALRSDGGREFDKSRVEQAASQSESGTVVNEEVEH